MELTGEEFIKRVTKGDEVAGAKVTGRITLINELIKQTDWSDCRFDSSVEIHSCTVSAAADGRGGRSGGRLDLEGARIAGRINIQNLGQAPDDHAANAHVSVLLRGAKVDGDLEVIADTRLALVVSNAEVAGQVVAKGNIRSLDGRDANIGSRLSIQLNPVEVIEYVSVTISRAIVGGDVEIIPHDLGVRQVFDKYQDLGVPHEIDIYVLADAERLKAGGDFMMGIPESDYSESRNWADITSNGINLRRAEISGEVLLRQVSIVKVESLEDNLHHYVAVAARKLHCGSLKISSLRFNLIIEDSSGIDEGESVQLVELDSAEVSGPVSLFRINGVVVCEPRDWSGPNIHGVSLQSLTCDSMKLAGLSVVNVDRKSVVLLPLDLDGVEVAGAAELKLKDRLSLDFDIGDEQQFNEISLALGSEITPEASMVGAEIAGLRLDEPPVKGKFDLTGAQIGRWKIGAGGQEEETYQHYLTLLDATKGLDVGLYRAVEKRLEDIGKRQDADAVHVAWQRRRRKERIFSQSKFRWFVSWLHDVTLGYGTKTWRPAFVLLGAFIISVSLTYLHYDQWVHVAASEYSELAACGEPCAARLDALKAERGDWARIRDGVALSTANLTPVIDLKVAAGLEAVPESVGAYWFLFLRLLGLIAWPVLLAGSLARLIHKRNLG